MKIVYDVELKHPKYWSELTGLRKIFFGEIREFVKRQLIVLKDEIEEEELVDEKRKTVICIIQQTDPYLSFHRFSEPLATKMNSCFCAEDWIYIQTKLAEDLGLQSLNFPS